MPTDLAEDSLDLTIDLLEAATPEIGDESYPFPRLKKTGRSEIRQFRTVVLENAYLQVTIAPDLGGRILRLYDKRTATEIVPYTGRIEVLEGGPRGAVAPSGIQLAVTGDERLNGMGTVTHMPDFSEDEEEPSAIWMGELCGNGLSFNCRIALPPERAEITIEMRLLNRSLEPVPINPGLIFGGGSVDGLVWSACPGVGVRVEASVPFRSGELALGRNGFLRFDSGASLGPRQLDSWTATLTPFSLPSGISGMSGEAFAHFDAQNLRIQSVEQRLGHKIVLLTETGQTLEAPADFYPETLFEIALGDLPAPIKALAILDPGRNEILRVEGAETGAEALADPEPLGVEWPTEAWSEAQLRQATFNLAQRHLAHLLLGYRRFAAKDYRGAGREFEQALLFNAEDHLTWWAKALAERLTGDAAEERAELLNAHFLAPLEPALRAESYLASPSHAKEPSSVLKPLAETPEAFIEVACLLLEAGLFEEASKWIDEALRHVDLPMLRYLLAYAYLSASRMGVEAADQVSAAGQKPATPPYPYRAVERRALAVLRERFPDDGTLAQYAAYLPL